MILGGCAHGMKPVPVASEIAASSDPGVTNSDAPREAPTQPPPLETQPESARSSPEEDAIHARQALAAAEAFFFALDVEAAAREATELLARIDRGVYGRFPRDIVKEALVVVVGASLALGDHSQADAAVDRLRVLDGVPALDPRQVSPAVRARVAARCERALGEAPLVVQGAPAGAALYVDGRRLPARAAEHRLPVGVHVVQVERRGRAPFTQRVDLSLEGAIVRVDLAPDMVAAGSVDGAQRAAPASPRMDSRTRRSVIGWTVGAGVVVGVGLATGLALARRSDGVDRWVAAGTIEVRR